MLPTGGMKPWMLDDPFGNNADARFKTCYPAGQKLEFKGDHRKYTLDDKCVVAFGFKYSKNKGAIA